MSDPSTTPFGPFPLIVNQVFFDELADQEGQVLDGYLVHMVDREAGTLRFGGTVLKTVKLFPMERGTFDGVRIIVSGPEAMAKQNNQVRAIGIPRGAQWKRERNAHRRAW